LLGHDGMIILFFETYNDQGTKMSSEDPTAGTCDADELDKNYKPPPQKTLEELLETDKEDESLRRYKEALLGGAAATGETIIFGKISPMIDGLLF